MVFPEISSEDSFQVIKMKIFISGATGFIGNKLAIRLAESGHTVHALYRSEDNVNLLKHKNIIAFKGDVMDKLSLINAIEGCEQVFHLAAFAKIYTRDPSVIYHLNIEGTMNIINASIATSVRRIVITSTAGVFGSSEAGKLVDESSVATQYFTHYEHSKAILTNILQSVSHGPVDIVTVNPTRVYGPGQLSESNSVTKMISAYLKGKWRLIPGNGKASGNYVFIDDVVEGHILAMEKGIAGENYILGGENAGYNDFFSRIEEVKGRKHRMIKIPLFVMQFVAGISTAWAFITGSTPLITPGLVRKFNHHFRVSSSKAIHHLGYNPIGLLEGLKATVKWLEK